ncbi:alpha/beta hydrolase [Solitalea lacus]|uniref:alpha/beta hydrolase n=1 Tax=Solitalea lacus TaxID=2911172 RepID=UPI001EDC8835|nr:acyl-CoA thioester hydrolase/BAAT C-terminal domain-containing protein [Solitalea lacus]UKJ07123.1 alpha/beta hydrolase [Solitalea lacus]
MKRTLTFIGILLASLFIIYIAGPTPEKPIYNTKLPFVPSDTKGLEQYVRSIDAPHKIKPENESKIIWADSTKEKTEYAILYLHGFSASHEEGNPVHINFAKRYGCNLYLTRLAEHGIDTSDAMANLTAEKYWRSAVQAYAVAKKLGRKVIILSTSTGGTLALKLAAEFPEIFALINLSPNIAINDPAAFITNNHWGLQLTKWVTGGNYRITKIDTAEGPKYWYYKYRVEAIPALEELIETSMNKETFEKVKCPVLTVCYFKDEHNQDPVVKVSAMRTMMQELGTPANLKEFIPLTTPENHVLGNPLKSKDVKSVENTCFNFAEKVLKLTPLRNI